MTQWLSPEEICRMTKSAEKKKLLKEAPLDKAGLWMLLWVVVFLCSVGAALAWNWSRP